MDNSECAKPVKSYKFKLRRTIKCYNRKHALMLEKDEYLLEIKEEGCDAKIKHTKDYVLEIPSADTKFGKTESLHPELRHLVKMFSDSTTTSLFEINYFLDVFVKHKSKVEFGMGNFVSFPIEIYQKRTNIAHMAQKAVDWLASQELALWEPEHIFAVSNLTMTKDSNGKINTEVVKQQAREEKRIEAVQEQVDDAAEMAKQLALNQEKERLADEQRQKER